VDKSEVEMAAKLLAKAASTEYDAEAIALVERSYGALAKTLTDYDEQTKDPDVQAPTSRPPP
jgi:hypothetical protein